MGPSRPAAQDQAQSVASGSGALLVFFGTLGVAATALLILVAIVPARFGLVQIAQPAAPEPGSPADGEPPATTDQGWSSADRGGLESPADWESPVAYGAGVGAEPSKSNGSSDEFSGPGQRAQMGWPSSSRPFAPRPASDGMDSGEPRPVVAREPAPPTLPERIFADANPSVVLVSTLTDSPGKFNDVSFVAGTGSGLVWDREGHIVTSRHVIDKVKGANITLSDGSIWGAKLINLDYEKDVAVLQIKPLGVSLTPIRVGTSHDLSVGMNAFSVACPYALRNSLTTGLISALDRNIKTPGGLRLGGMIQTDTTMHRGSSGGALIDDQGRVVGMNTAVHVESGLASGVGFAIPIDSLQEIVPRLIRTGMHWHDEFGFLTLSGETSVSTLNEYETYLTRGRRVGASPLSRPVVGRRPELPARGLVITEVEAESGAAKAGLRRWVPLPSNDGFRRIVPQDVVIGAGGEPVSSSSDLERAIASLGPDEPLRLDVWRNGDELSLMLQRTATHLKAERAQER